MAEHPFVNGLCVLDSLGGRYSAGCTMRFGDHCLPVIHPSAGFMLSARSLGAQQRGHTNRVSTLEFICRKWVCVSSSQGLYVDTRIVSVLFVAPIPRIHVAPAFWPAASSTRDRATGGARGIRVRVRVYQRGGATFRSKYFSSAELRPSRHASGEIPCPA